MTACASLCATYAQEAKTCFVNMPDSLTLLTAVNRADCIDFLESNMKAEVTNRLNGKSTMTVLTPDYIHVQTTAQSTWQMKLLTVNDTTKVICTITTVSAPASDSHIRFYTTDWKELDSSSFLPALPTLEEFITATDTEDESYAYRDARRQADILFLKAELSPTAETLTLILTTPEYMEKEAAETLRPYLRPPFIYHWDTGKFVVRK